MFVYVIKASKLKFFAVVLFASVVLLTLIALTPGYRDVPTQDVAAVSTKYGKLQSNDDRVKFIEQFGYTVDREPLEITDVNIPEKFDSAYTEYNDIQRAQGLNLAKHKGKKATRYTYNITNHPLRDGKVMINLLMINDTVIAGDVCCVEGEGFIHGFEIPDSFKVSENQQ